MFAERCVSRLPLLEITMNLDPKFADKHSDHQVTVRFTPTEYHPAHLRCVDCDRWLKWLRLEEANRIHQIITQA